MKYKYAASVLAAGILWGIISIFIKKLSASGLNHSQICALRIVISAVIFTAFLLITDRTKLKIKLKDIWLFVGTGIVSVVLFDTCYFYTMLESEVSVAVVLLYTSPVFVMIMSLFVFKEKFTVKKIIALIITLAGVVLVAGIFGGSYNITPLVLLAGIGAGFFYALYSIFGKLATKKYSSLTVTAYTFIFGSIAAIPICNPINTAQLICADPVILVWGLGIAVCCTIMPYVFYTYGLQGMESGKAAILAAIEPVTGTLLGIIAYNESSDVLKIIGIVLILASIVLLNVNIKKRDTALKPAEIKNNCDKPKQ